MRDLAITVLPFLCLHIGGQAFGQKVSCSAEPVEKVQMANSGNFGTIKNQQLTGHRKPQNAQIQGFSTVSLHLHLFPGHRKSFDIGIIY